MSSSAKKPTRAAAKSTPFSAPSVGGGGGDGGGGAGGATRSRLQRSAMTASLRKARRGQAVARKRHMTLPASSDGAMSMAGVQHVKMGENPYSRDAAHVRETVDLATSIVSACSGGSVEGRSSLPSMLERLCVLLTPDDANNDSAKVGLPNRKIDPAAGASYDSSMAGMAANSVLSQFVGDGDASGVGSQIPEQQQVIGQNNNLALLLANSLAGILDAANSADRTVKIKAAIVLNQLAATEPPPPIASSFDQDQYSPYGRPPQNASLALSVPASWCHVLVNSRALSSLVNRLPRPNSGTDSLDLELCSKCAWAVGNLAGDSHMAREALYGMGTICSLIWCVKLGISAVAQRQPQQQMPSFLADTARNSIWALTNLYREGDVPAHEFLDLDRDQGGQLPPRLTAGDVSSLVAAPDSTTASWKDVAVEACWLISFLSRDLAAVDFLCAEGSSVIPMLVARLARDTDFTGLQLSSGTASGSVTMEGVTGCLIPCCRALKNIAIASDGRHASSVLMARILAATTSNMAAATEGPPVESSLSKLISLGTLGAGNHVESIASEAASLAGALLYDAGYPLPHPATAACRTLLPSLCSALVCPLAKFEFKREVVWAIWNAVYSPLGYQEMRENNVAGVQNDLLAEVLRNSPQEMAKALVDMVNTLDSDAVEASLRLVDLLLRRLDGAKARLPALFEEAGLVDALWRVCDRDTEESELAELAANLLDDFYENDEDGNEDADESMLQPNLAGGQFQFQSPQVGGVPEGGFDFGAPQMQQQQQQQQLPAAGRGRGRGRAVPAWMK